MAQFLIHEACRDFDGLKIGDLVVVDDYPGAIWIISRISARMRIGGLMLPLMISCDFHSGETQYIQLRGELQPIKGIGRERGDFRPYSIKNLVL